jgi:hypothetical protein
MSKAACQHIIVNVAQPHLLPRSDILHSTFDSARELVHLCQNLESVYSKVVVSIRLKMPPSPLPDIVKDLELRAAFSRDTTLHRWTSTDDSGTRVSHEETWKVDSHLGQGSYGKVWKECCISANDRGERGEYERSS